MPSFGKSFSHGSHIEIPVSFYGRSEFSFMFSFIDLSDGPNNARGASFWVGGN